MLKGVVKSNKSFNLIYLQNSRLKCSSPSRLSPLPLVLRSSALSLGQPDPQARIPTSVLLAETSCVVLSQRSEPPTFGHNNCRQFKVTFTRTCLQNCETAKTCFEQTCVGVTCINFVWQCDTIMLTEKRLRYIITATGQHMQILF